MTSHFRLYGAVLLLLGEMFFLSIVVDSSTISQKSFISGLLSNAGNVLRWIIVSAGLLVLYFTQINNWTSQRIRDDRPAIQIFLTFLVHLFLFVAVALVTFWLFQIGHQITSAQSLIWMLLILAVSVTWGLIIVGLSRWKIFLLEEKWRILGLGSAALVIVVAGTYFQQFWEVLNVFTLSATRVVLEIFYDNLYFDYAGRKLGVPEFWVIIDSACSGIEGIVVAVSTTAIYLFLSRNELRFPQALALIPIACLFSILLNVVRIAALIGIGIEVSPRLAVEGFHSVAGWLAAVIVALIIIFVFSSWRWILRPTSKSHNPQTQESDHDVAIAILTPFAVFVMLTLTGRVFSSEFEYFYPLKMTITGLVLIYYWKSYRLRIPTNYLEIIFAAGLTAGLWILLSDHQPDLDQALVESLSRMSWISATVWILWRVMSFWVVVPIFEELVFRGYLMSRIAGHTIDNSQRLPFHWAGLLVSSVLFGFIHEAWVAGFLAGIIFGYLRFRSVSMTSCILAHGLTNFLISVWAMYSNRWSLI